MNINPKIFKAYDIRGIYPNDINEENIVQISKAIYAFFSQKLNKKDFTLVLGRDMRLSSPLLFKAIKDTLFNLGVNIIDVGLVSTPTFYFTVSHYGYDTGIQITASHNPKEYNGLKFVMNSPKGLIKIGKSTGMEDIKKMAAGNLPNLENKKGAVTEKSGVLEEEVVNALKIAGNPKIRKFKIVADPANAMGSLYLNEFFKKVPGELIRMNFDLDGTFPAHQPDPLKTETLIDLQKRVVSEKADLGLAPDGDGDRLFFIDEKGQIVEPTTITSIVARELLSKFPVEEILFDVRYILTPQKIVEENGGKSEVTKVGHAFITEKLHETGAIFAGESSSHFYFRATGNAESTLPVVAMVLKVMTKENKKLSELREELRRSYESGEVNFKVSNAQEILEKLKEKYKDGKLSDLDGIAISYPTWRFNVRTSNTEPLLRLNLESTDENTMKEKKDEVIGLIKSSSKPL